MPLLHKVSAIAYLETPTMTKSCIKTLNKSEKQLKNDRSTIVPHRRIGK